MTKVELFVANLISDVSRFYMAAKNNDTKRGYGVSCIGLQRTEIIRSYRGGLGYSTLSVQYVRLIYDVPSLPHYPLNDQHSGYGGRWEIQQGFSTLFGLPKK